MHGGWTMNACAIVPGASSCIPFDRLLHPQALAACAAMTDTGFYRGNHHWWPPPRSRPCSCSWWQHHMMWMAASAAWEILI